MGRNYWLHRITGHHKYLAHPLIEKGYLSIGFSDLIDKGLIDSDKNDFEKKLVGTWLEGPRNNRHTLKRYIYDMKKGDYVVVPMWSEFCVYEITEDKAMLPKEIDINGLLTWEGNSVKLSENGKLLCQKDNKEEVVDLGFFRKVKPVFSYGSRSRFADAALTSRMKFRGTNADINNIKESVEKAIKYAEENKPIDLHAIVQEKISKSTLESIKKELNPAKFEGLIRSYFEHLGFKCKKKNERSKEGDSDLNATCEKIKTVIYVQVKFHKDSTSDYAVEQINSYKINKEEEDNEYSHQAWVITTADKFTPEAVNAGRMSDVRLVNGLEFAKMILENGIDCLKTE